MDIEPNLYEGDIVLPSNPDESNELRQKRNAQRLRQYIWKTKIVPYEVSDILGKISFQFRSVVKHFKGEVFSFCSFAGFGSKLWNNLYP